MFPLRDLNPTRITPFVTLMLIAASLGVYFFIQAVDSLIEQQEFLFRRAAISCEITTGSPLSIGEITTRTCGVGGTPLFPNKSELLAVLTSMFLHGSIGHVVFNMWFLWIFGNNVEEGFGHVRYLLMYLKLTSLVSSPWMVACATPTAFYPWLPWLGLRKCRLS